MYLDLDGTLLVETPSLAGDFLGGAMLKHGDSLQSYKQTLATRDSRGLLKAKK